MRKENLMFFKNFKIKKTILFLLLLLIMPITVHAYSDYIIPGGENIGIELEASGVMVVGTYEVGSQNPASEAGLKVGDKITAVNETAVTTINKMVQAIDQNKSKGEVEITFVRGKDTKKTTLKLYQDKDQVYKTGLYVKDRITGIGTLSFIDPNTKLFGALGHEIIEKSTGQMLEIKDGKIFESTVTDIVPSENGTPGEKNAKYNYKQVYGSVSENTEKGIFGTYSSSLPDKKQYKVAVPSSIKLGKATIRTVISGNTAEEFEINILKVNENDKTKNILFEITDDRLLQATGGIVAGMSGSPILQGDNMIGCITHVVIDDPKRGYGIFITNMLEEAEN